MGSSPHVTHAFSRIRFKHLQIVDAITHYGSVHAAARGLNMTNRLSVKFCAASKTSSGSSCLNDCRAA